MPWLKDSQLVVRAVERARLMADEKRTIHELMPMVMAAVGVIGKSAKNEKAGYAARAIDDVMNGVHGALTAHGVFFTPKVEKAEYEIVLVGRNQTPMRQVTTTVRYTFYGPMGDSVDAVVNAEALDSGDKASSKALSMALKYALLQVFCVPTKDMADPDTESHERSAPAPKPLDLDAFHKACEDAGVDPADVLAHAEIGKTLGTLSDEDRPALKESLKALTDAKPKPPPEREPQPEPGK